MGAHFPPRPNTGPRSPYWRKIADELRNEGVLGRFSIDFISVKDEAWKHYAIEISLRKGGTASLPDAAVLNERAL